MVKNNTNPTAIRKRSPRVNRNMPTIADAAAAMGSGLLLLRRSLGRIEHVADASNRMNHFDGVFVVNLASQVANVNVDDVGESVVIHVPDVLDDHRAAQGAA